MLSIEFYSAHNQVKPWVLDWIRRELTTLHEAFPSISHAEINFHKRHGISANEEVCEMNISMFGESVFVQKAAESFELATRLVLEAVEKMAADHKGKNAHISH